MEEVSISGSSTIITSRIRFKSLRWKLGTIYKTTLIIYHHLLLNRRYLHRFMNRTASLVCSARSIKFSTFRRTILCLEQQFEPIRRDTDHKTKSSLCDARTGTSMNVPRMSIQLSQWRFDVNSMTTR